MTFLFVFDVLDEISLLYVDGEMMIVLVCAERDSRDRCLPDHMTVVVFVRNASLPSDVGTKLTSLNFAPCILPSDIGHLVQSYTSALHSGKFSEMFYHDDPVFSHRSLS